MAGNEWLTIPQLKAVFGEEIKELGGNVLDTFEDGVRIFSRATIPWVSEITPEDSAQGGVALRAKEGDIFLHSYLFRQVCQNGLIISHDVSKHRIKASHFPSPLESELAVRKAIQDCCLEESFAKTVEQMQLGREMKFNPSVSLGHHMPHLPPGVGFQIFTRFIEGVDSSWFDFINVVTSVARDIIDPEVRWRLEEFGGLIAAGLNLGSASSESIERAWKLIAGELDEA